MISGKTRFHFTERLAPLFKDKAFVEDLHEHLLNVNENDEFALLEKSAEEDKEYEVSYEEYEVRLFPEVFEV